MVGLNSLVGVALLYAAVLFAVAFLADRRAARGRDGWMRSPTVYTLSLSIYCTGWTFYGAVGSAARSGLEFLTIYLGPTLVVIGWFLLLRRLVRIGRTHRITSIADLISSRFGKSTELGVIVTLLAVIGITPYIALQLQSVTLSFSAFAEAGGSDWGERDITRTGIWVAAGLALFTVLFGTRNLDANERHHGIVIAIAVEAVVKLTALLAVGVFVVWGIAGGVGETIARIDASQIAEWDQQPGRWVTLMFLSAAAFVCLPRMFQVMVVENADEQNLFTASWAFPAYLMAISLFVLPIAVIGLDLMPEGSNPDLFVLSVPLSQGQNGLAILSFLGGFSSATSMVIVATIALATMVSNHIVVPIWLSRQTGTTAMVSGDVREVMIMARRISIIVIMGLGYVYYRATGGSAALASIGIISFVGITQVLPALLAGIFWRAATRVGAAAGLLMGLAVWLWCLFLPTFGPAVMPPSVLAEGPFALSWLRPQALFGVDGLDPVVHAVFWSMLLNTAGVVVGSLLSFPRPIERLQGAQFVNVFEHSTASRSWSRSAASAEDLLIMVQRIMGPQDAQQFFAEEAQRQGLDSTLPLVTPSFVETLERRLAGSVGAATAHAMIGQIIEGATVSVDDLIAVADEAAQIMEYSNRLEAKSREQEATARALRLANEKLRALSVQKDAFLSQISHELRTPMTSIRSFSEILSTPDLEAPDRTRYASIIHEEAKRLTRLLDDLLDLSVLENGQVTLNMSEGHLTELLDRAVSTAAVEDRLTIIRDRAAEAEVALHTDLDRLSQVFINLITNAAKYCDAPSRELTIMPRRDGEVWVVDFRDNGRGIPAASRQIIFEKFSRLGDHGKAGGAGLGLAICREIMARLGGGISLVGRGSETTFRVQLPQPQALAAQ